MQICHNALLLRIFYLIYGKVDTFFFFKYVHTLFLKDPFLTYFTVLHHALDKGQMYHASSFIISPLYTGNPLTSPLPNSEDTYEMQHNAALFAEIKTTFKDKNSKY